LNLFFRVFSSRLNQRNVTIEPAAGCRDAVQLLLFHGGSAGGSLKSSAIMTVEEKKKGKIHIEAQLNRDGKSAAIN
jgi:hypothetical protein